MLFHLLSSPIFYSLALPLSPPSTSCLLPVHSSLLFSSRPVSSFPLVPCLLVRVVCLPHVWRMGCPFVRWTRIGGSGRVRFGLSFVSLFVSLGLCLCVECALVVKR